MPATRGAGALVCYSPLVGYRVRVGDPLSFSRREGEKGEPVNVPCGRCVGCRLERSRQWAMRIMHEAHMYNDNSYITLTYEDSQLPERNSLDVRDWQLFMKRVRKHYSPLRIKVFYCGEYGAENWRPHFHAILFNLDFADKEFHMLNKHQQPLYTSETLARLWGKGFVTIGDVTFESAGYVARYCLKKMTGRAADGHYLRVDRETGEFYSLTPEFAYMSNGIGEKWFREYASDVYPKDYCTFRGIKMRPPKAYDRFVEEEPLPSLVHFCNEPNGLLKVKAAREEFAFDHEGDATEERLAVRESVKLAQVTRLKRS